MPTTKHEPVTPDQLVTAFCGDQFKEYRAGASGWVDGTDQASGAEYRMARGWCGLNDRDGDPEDHIVRGFQDGYEFVHYLGDRGWFPIYDKGEWPLVAYVIYAVKVDGRLVLAEYLEYDLTLWSFATKQALAAFTKGLRDAP